MTLLEFFGCSLISFSPALIMFIFTVANNPLKIIILTCSAFFWLLSLLLSSIVWFAVVPLRKQLVFSMVVSILFQEAIRIAFYFFINGGGGSSGGGGGAAAASSAGGSEPLTDADQVTLTAGTGRPVKILHLHSLSYVCGLGFGFMAGAFSMVNLLADISGPGSVGLGGEHEGFLLVSSVLALMFVFLNICWTVVTFVCIEDRRLYFLAYVWGSHLLCSLLTLLNSSASPLLSLVPIMVSLTCALIGLLLSLHLVEANLAGFFTSLVSPAWMLRVCRR
uniref:Gamma-secretase subunit Aph-1 n=1 Tax=Macrostomum lignano TaxID=282301 RepID=A0A1I8FX25_9PLAT